MRSEELAEALNAMMRQNFKLVDLSYVIEELMPSWPTHAKFGHLVLESYEYGDPACHYQLTMSEHTGTHMDAPLHFIARGKNHYGPDRAPLDRFFGRAVFIDASNLSPCELFTRGQIESWESANFLIKEGDIVLFRFGWDRFYGLRPDDARYLKDWPGLSADAAEYLVSKKVSLVGTDALSLDGFLSNNEAHHILLGNEVYILENLNNLDQLSPLSFVIMLPLKIKDGSGSPLRVMALVPVGNDQP